MMAISKTRDNPMKLKVVSDTLSDRSKVYDVILVTDEGAILRFNCVDEAAATVFAEMLHFSVNDFTLQTATLN
jgi:hypothetical protein